MNNLHKLPFAPSVAIQEIPSQTIAELLGLKPDDEDEEENQDEEDDNDLDARIHRISRRAYEGRIEVDSPTASEAEDVDLSDSETTSSSGSLNRNGLGCDRYNRLRSKRKFFRSSLLWDPEQSELRGTIAALYCKKRAVDPNGMANGWPN